MRIACVGYRDWSLNIYDELAKRTDNIFLIFRSKKQFDEIALRDFKPDLILFYGWSWYVPDQLLSDFDCLMLHPSPLPKYRGGSPLQNQIIAGEKDSKVSIFIMNKELDAGPIVAQGDLSLEGSLDSIFDSIVETGISLTSELIENGLVPVEQNHSEKTYYSRRKPEESEITLEEIMNKPAEYIHNKIRMLSDPYPNAFFRTADGKRILIKESAIADT